MSSPKDPVVQCAEMVSRCFDVWRGVTMSAQETATLANSMCRREFERRKDTWEDGSSVFGEVIDAALMHDRVVAQFALRRQLSEPGET